MCQGARACVAYYCVCLGFVTACDDLIHLLLLMMSHQYSFVCRDTLSGGVAKKRLHENTDEKKAQKRKEWRMECAFFLSSAKQTKGVGGWDRFAFLHTTFWAFFFLAFGFWLVGLGEFG